MNNRLVATLGTSLLVVVAGACGDTTAPATPRPTPWIDNVLTQPVPEWGSPVRLNLPVPISSIDFVNGLGGFGAHEGGHVEGLNHVWIPTTPGTIIRSWAAGTVTKIEDMGSRGTPDGRHEYFITIDYGQGLIGKHLDADTPLVKVGDVVAEGAPVAPGASAELLLIDNNRSDGERTGSEHGSPVSPFDYLRADVKAALLARYTATVVTPYFQTGRSIGSQRPWEPLLTNKMLYHADHRGTFVGEWILASKAWNVVDPLYFDVMAIFDVTNAYGHFQQLEMMDHDWSLPGNKRVASGTWQSEAPGKIIVTLSTGPALYGLYAVDESSGRAKLTIEWKAGAYPPAITSAAAVYVERAPIYLLGDVQALGIAK